MPARDPAASAEIARMKLASLLTIDSWSILHLDLVPIEPTNAQCHVRVSRQLDFGQAFGVIAISRISDDAEHAFNGRDRHVPGIEDFDAELHACTQSLAGEFEEPLRRSLLAEI